MKTLTKAAITLILLSITLTLYTQTYVPASGGTFSGTVNINDILSVKSLSVGNNDQATKTDLLLTGNANIATSASMHFFIDHDDNGSNSFYFKQGAAFGTGTILMELKHNGALNLTNTLKILNDNAYLKLHSSNANGQQWELRSTGSSGNFSIYNEDRAQNDLTILADGSIGMGTSTPATALHIHQGDVGSAPALLRLQSDTEAGTSPGDVYAGLEFGVSGGENSSGGQEVTAFIKAVDTRTGTTSGEDGGLSFGTLHTSGSATEKMLITGAGDVGIGTSTPEYKLDVSGTSRFTAKMIVEDHIESKKVKVMAAPGSFPDYVFADDYELKTLNELEAFIKANRHLPGLPKAEEVETNGQDLGLIQQKNLEKIEELTLYAIEAYNQRKQLEAENQALKEKNKMLEARLDALLQRVEKLEETQKSK